MILNRLEFLLMNNPLRASIQRHFEAPRLVAMGGVIEFLLPVKQFPASRLLKRGDEARPLITLVADTAGSSRHDIRGLCLSEGCHVVIMPGNGLGYE